MQQVLELRRTNEERRRGDEARAGVEANLPLGTRVAQKRTAVLPSAGPTTDVPPRAGPSSIEEPEDDSPLVAALRKNPMFSMVPDAQFCGEREKDALFLQHLRSLRGRRAKGWSKVKLTPSWEGNEFDRVLSQRPCVSASAPHRPVRVAEPSGSQDRKRKRGEGEGPAPTRSQ